MIKKRKIPILIITSLLLLTPIVNINKVDTVYATNINSFYNIDVKDYQNYNNLITKITSQNNKQGIEYLKIIAKWKTYSPSTTEKQKDIQNFIEFTKQNYAFINSYEDTKYVGDLKYNYNYYISDLNNLINNPSLFETNSNITYLEYMVGYPALAQVYNDYRLFKTNAIDKFISETLYKNDLKIALKQVQDPNTKAEGQTVLQNYINTLDQIQQNVNNAPTIRNLAIHYMNHYKNILANGTSPNSNELIEPEKERVQGLFCLNNEFYNVSEYQSYKLLFDNFNEYTNLDIMKSKTSKDINKQIQLLIDTPVYSEQLIDIKLKQYNFLYELNNYKKSNNDKELQKVYNDLSSAVTNMQYYSELLNIRYNGLTTGIILNEVQNFNTNMLCIDPNTEILKYQREVVKDNNAYRILKEHNKLNINMFKVLPFAFVIVVFCAIIIIYKKSKESKDSYNNQDYYNNYNNSNDYYNNDNYNTNYNNSYDNYNNNYNYDNNYNNYNGNYDNNNYYNNGEYSQNQNNQYINNQYNEYK